MDDPRFRDRITLAHAFLGRPPIVLMNPYTGVPFFIESEPDDWRQFLEEADQKGGVDAVAAHMRKIRSMN